MNIQEAEEAEEAEKSLLKSRQEVVDRLDKLDSDRSITFRDISDANKRWWFALNVRDSARNGKEKSDADKDMVDASIARDEAEKSRCEINRLWWEAFKEKKDIENAINE